MIHTTIAGKPCEVPEGLNAIQAMWYCGINLTHGIGCLGGVCGACTMTYQLHGSPVKTALGCQTQVIDGMSFNLFAADVKRAVPYKTSLDPKRGMDTPLLKNHFNETLSATRRCVACGACTAVCPQEIDVMKGVKEAINSDFKKVSGLFLNCVMCGLCAAVCEVQVLPHLVGLYSRKVTSLYLSPKTVWLEERVEEIRSGYYEAEMKRLLNYRESDWAREFAAGSGLPI
jgi:formate hydrogenlyase subunit 6/NADH:ubiquinone oxidoreductase subunit I